ncbi:MAG: lactamase [Dehalococcoidia bacterium]|nr:lactamase [Dehalococcoidia bacterium]
MEIYWLGHGCFRLRGRDATVVTDPCPPTTGYRISRVPGDIITISQDAAESSYTQAVNGEPKLVTGPGEYEIAGVLISAIRTEHSPDDPDARRNIAYVIDLDDIRICHLGGLRQVPNADEAEALSAADVLIIPVGGGKVLDAAKAAETLSLLEPKIVLPMQYKTDASTGELDPVEKFLREMGAEAKPPESRLTVTRRDIPSDTSIVLLNYRG